MKFTIILIQGFFLKVVNCITMVLFWLQFALFPMQAGHAVKQAPSQAAPGPALPVKPRDDCDFCLGTALANKVFGRLRVGLSDA
jgi:hypothetical protein